MSPTRRLLVLADDFSGACEIAGLISRYGRSAEIQLVPDLNSSADTIVVDLDTRQPDASSMEARMAAFLPLLQKHVNEFIVFKKVDSVFRGHILREIHHLLEVLKVQRVFLLPANPETGRKIIDGVYYINGELLHQTIFSTDPHFPKTTSTIDTVIDYRDIPLRHIHINKNILVPDSGLLTADISSMDDLDYYTSLFDRQTLYCGGAQCFDSFIRNMLHWQQGTHRILHALPEGRRYIINGSTIKTDTETGLLKKYEIKRYCLPGQIRNNTYVYEHSSFETRIFRMIDKTDNNTVSYFHINLPVLHEQRISESILLQLVRLSGHLLRHHQDTALHLLLTGGATASAILRGNKETAVRVITEHAQGVVTVSSERDTNHIFTIKPGSYPWPESLFKQIAT